MDLSWKAPAKRKEAFASLPFEGTAQWKHIRYSVFPDIRATGRWPIGRGLPVDEGRTRGNGQLLRWCICLRGVRVTRFVELFAAEFQHLSFNPSYDLLLDAAGQTRPIMTRTTAH